MQGIATVYRQSQLEMFFTAIAVWSLCLVTFRLPGRTDPSAIGSLDLLAVAKLGVRCGVLMVFLYAWRWNPDRHAKQRVLKAYSPFLLFVAWAFLSVIWSPLKTVSFGQALGLAALTMLSAWVALACRSTFDAAQVIKHLWGALTFISFLVITTHLLRPDLSGLDRELFVRGANGLVRPTMAGATAGLGLSLTMIAPKLVPGLQLGLMRYPAIGAHLYLLFLAQSRTSWAMTLVICLVAILRYYPRVVHARAMLVVSMLICATLMFDPGFVLHENSQRASADYLSRDQSAKQLAQVSGRMEMWTAVWEQFQLAPFIGHGYFVSSETGKLDVWEGPANHTAHNIMLQVLVSTGIIGGLFFTFAFFKAALDISRLRGGDKMARCSFGITALFGIWYLGWSQTCISFIGPILPESVLFFVLLGLAMGQVVRLRSLEYAPESHLT